MFSHFQKLKSLSYVKKAISKTYLPKCGRQTCICVDILNTHQYEFKKDNKKHIYLINKYKKCFKNCQRWK